MSPRNAPTVNTASSSGIASYCRINKNLTFFRCIILTKPYFLDSISKFHFRVFLAKFRLGG
jgi:hypothetical protein